MGVFPNHDLKVVAIQAGAFSTPQKRHGAVSKAALHFYGKIDKDMKKMSFFSIQFQFYPKNILMRYFCFLLAFFLFFKAIISRFLALF